MNGRHDHTTKERISRILELREILLSFQTGSSLVNAAVVCANLESISGLEPSSVITGPRYLKLVTVSSSGQVLWTCTGRKTLQPSTSLPVMGEIVGVSTTSLGGRLHSTKTRARWAEGFTMNSSATCSTWRGIRSVRLYFAQDSQCDDNKQPSLLFPIK